MVEDNNSKKSNNQDDREENAIVLDFLKHGYPFDDRPSHKKKSIVQGIGKDFFTLLELVPKKGVELQPGDEVYIGDGKREDIHFIKSRLDYEKLTETAKSVLESNLEDLVIEQEDRFVEFFNEAQPLTSRMHQLELLPGLGKKHMWKVIEERKKESFDSFEDIKDRVKLMGDPKKVIVDRIESELKGEEKHNLFVS